MRVFDSIKIIESSTISPFIETHCYNTSQRTIDGSSSSKCKCYFGRNVIKFTASRTTKCTQRVVTKHGKYSRCIFEKKAQLESVGFIFIFICSFFVLFSCLFSLYLVFTPFSNNFAIAWAYFYSDYLPMKNRRSTKILTIQNR